MRTKEAEQFEFWRDRFAADFQAMDSDSLKSAWWLYGRDSEETAPPRDLAAWAAVNAEMQARGM